MRVPDRLCGPHSVEKPSGSVFFGVVDHGSEVGGWFVAADTKNGENPGVIALGSGNIPAGHPGAGWMLTINSWRLLGLIFRGWLT